MIPELCGQGGDPEVDELAVEEDNLSTARAELRRRARRAGLFYAGLSLIVAVSFSLLFRVWAGVICGVLSLALGIYCAFAYAPLAGWLSRHERSH